MKILHFADLHLGVETYGVLNPETGLSTRLEDFLQALEQVVSFAVDHEVDLVLFCGDAYRDRDPSQTQQREFARSISQLAGNNIPVFLLVGNHDLPNAFGKAVSTEIFETLSVKNVCVARRPGIYRIQTRSGMVQILGLPFARRSNLLSKEETKGLTVDGINERLEQILTETIETNSKALDTSLPSVLAAHVAIATAQTGSERTMLLGREPVLLPSNVFKPVFDYVALGHIHKYQLLSTAPYGAYSGSLVRIDFSEEKDEKGFCVVDISIASEREKRSTSFTFQTVSGRRFLTIPFEIKPQDLNPMATILSALARRSEEVKDAIVRLQITVPLQLQGMIQENVIRQSLKEAHYVLPIALNVPDRTPRGRLGKLADADNISPQEALRIYLRNKSTSPEMTQVLLKYGDRLIKEMSGDSG